MTTKLINYLRIVLYTLLVVTVFTLFQIWQKEHPVIPVVAQTPQTLSQMIPQENSLPHSVQPASSTTASIAPVAVAKNKLIYIKTDVLEATINPKGGNIINLKLLKYPEKLHSDHSTILLTNDAVNEYIAKSGLYSETGPNTNQGEALFSSTQTQYHLEDNQNNLTVELKWRNANGVNFIKTYTFHRNDYAIQMNYQIDNQSAQAWKGNLYLQLMRKNTPPPSHHGLMGFGLSTYFGAAISSPDKLFQKVPFKKMEEQPLDKTIQGGWVAMLQHYFLSAWVPDKNISARYFSQVLPNGLYTIGIYQPTIIVNPGETLTTGAQLYTGPEIADNLVKVSPSLKLTIDYGIF